MVLERLVVKRTQSIKKRRFVFTAKNEIKLSSKFMHTYRTRSRTAERNNFSPTNVLNWLISELFVPASEPRRRPLRGLLPFSEANISDQGCRACDLFRGLVTGHGVHRQRHGGRKSWPKRLRNDRHFSAACRAHALTAWRKEYKAAPLALMHGIVGRQRVQRR